MSNRISGTSEVQISYSTDTDEYLPTYNSFIVISDVAYDNKSSVSVSFDLSNLVATNAAAGASTKLESNEYSTSVSFTLTNTESYRISNNNVDPIGSTTSQADEPGSLAARKTVSASLISGDPAAIDLSFGLVPILFEYPIILTTVPVNDG